MPITEEFSPIDLIERFPPGTVIGTPAFNKIAAINSMIDFFAKKDPSCVERYFKTPYINHNTRAPDGIAPVLDLAQRAVKWDGVHTIVRRAFAEGDLVVLHSVYSNLLGIKGQRVAFDLFRFDNGKIVEHWDALQNAVAPDACGLGQIDGSVDITDRGQEAANRGLVIDFVKTVLVEGRQSEVSRFIDEADYIDHVPQRDAGLVRRLCNFVSAADAPQVSYLRFHKTLAEGNFVLVQGEGRIGETQVLEVYDLFRLHAGKIVEHWDVLQPLAPADQWANPNGPY